jgi:hypothetical protein
LACSRCWSLRPGNGRCSSSRDLGSSLRDRFPEIGSSAGRSTQTGRSRASSHEVRRPSSAPTLESSLPGARFRGASVRPPHRHTPTCRPRATPVRPMRSVDLVPAPARRPTSRLPFVAVRGIREGSVLRGTVRVSWHDRWPADGTRDDGTARNTGCLRRGRDRGPGPGACVNHDALRPRTVHVAVPWWPVHVPSCPVQLGAVLRESPATPRGELPRRRTVELRSGSGPWVPSIGRPPIPGPNAVGRSPLRSTVETG